MIPNRKAVVEMIIGFVTVKKVFEFVGGKQTLLRLSLLVTALTTVHAASFTTFQVPGCGQTVASAINNKNVVVGSSGCGAFIRDAAGHFTTFTVNGNPTNATGVNIHGAVVGTYSVGVCIPSLPGVDCVYGYVRSPSGVVTTIQNPSGLPLFVQLGINARGQIAGTVNAGTSGPQAFFRDVDGTFTLLQTSFQQQGFKGGVVTGINNAGEIAGAAFLPISDLARAFIRAPNGTLNIIGPVSTQDNWAIGINRLGGVVGTANTLMNGFITTQGFLQTATGAPVLFPVPFIANDGGLPFQRVVGGGINAHGAAVLQNVYISPTVVVTPIDLGPCLNVVAEAINDDGWVTGRCGGDAFLWRK